MEFIYPQYLRPRVGQKEIKQKEIFGYFFVRETVEDIYTIAPSGIDFSSFNFEASENNNISNKIRTLITKPTGHEDICCLSVYLYGVYTEEDCGIQCKKDSDMRDHYYTYWDFCTDPIEINNTDFIKTERYPLYFNISRILSESINNRCIRIQNETDGGYDEKRLEINFIHKPTQINYWHFEFRLFIDNEVLSKEELKQKRKLNIGIKTFMKNQLLSCIDWSKNTVKFQT